ncbi:MAG: hypothetical protein QOD83_990 [Solirubrobacteraceae bacterium]|jgi:hypothetical protein|nr:hypothetical protein [Solirubrobacteraceae bacterium]
MPASTSTSATRTPPCQRASNENTNGLVRQYQPLADADYRRAWGLYTQITGYAAPFDRHAP